MDKSDLFIPVVLGTARVDRRSELAAQYMFEQTQAYGLPSELVDVRTMTINETIPSWVEDADATGWRKLVAKADGLIIVSPEYNHGYPGELKMLLDRAYDEYKQKPVAVCGTGGGLGGARMVEGLRTVLIELSMVPIRNAIYFSGIKELFDEEGRIKDDTFAERIETLLTELTWYALALKEARNADK